MSSTGYDRPDRSVTEWAWQVIRSARKLVRGREPPKPGAFFVPAADGTLRQVPTRSEQGSLAWQAEHGWEICPGFPAAVSDPFALYLPICGDFRSSGFTVGHLGQSLDGYIATQSGDAVYVTGQENIIHLHRMRALCDSVIVGAETVVADNPRLTTRLVEGDNPVRAVLDPRRRLHPEYEVFRDHTATTLLICSRDHARGDYESPGRAEVIAIGCENGRLDLAALLSRLRERGLSVSFVEGGGTTVSAFAQAGLLDRLQIAVAPVLIGNGRPGLQIPPAAALRDCWRPRHRVFRMGEDILFDCEPRARGTPESGGRHAEGIRRIL